MTLSGGGVVTWGGGYLSWDGRAYVAPVQNPTLSTDGVYYIDCPPAGTVITCYTPAGLTTITLTGSGFPLGIFQALYWFMPIPAGQAPMGASNFYIVDKGATNWTPSGNAFLLATANGKGLKWMPSQITIPNNSTFDCNTGQASWLPSLVSISNIANNYLTSGSLINYITSGSLTNYVTSGSLATYVTSGSLATYVTCGSLTNYITSGSLTNYITSGSLTNYITSGSLTNYITSGSLATCYNW
jgi:hypothetical protein